MVAVSVTSQPFDGPPIDYLCVVQFCTLFREKNPCIVQYRADILSIIFDSEQTKQ